MSIVDKMKTTLSNSDVERDDWNVLTNKEDIKEVIKRSKDRPQLIYKHSHRCGTCLVARKEIENNFEAIKEQTDMNFVNVVKNRAVSDEISERLEVRHESPQVLIIHNGEAVWHESHHSIESHDIIENLQILSN